MSEAVDWVPPIEAVEVFPQEADGWPRPELYIVKPETTMPAANSNDEYIRRLVAAGHTVVSYMNTHRDADGRPRRFGPTYPL